MAYYQEVNLSYKVERTTLEKDGILASLFLPQSETIACSTCIITLGGASGGLSESRAQLLASHGFAALSLAYFAMEGLPCRLEEIPIEYFEKAFAWLENHPTISFDRIALWGVSRGSELSLLLGSLFPEKIKALVAYAPTSVIYGALIDPEKPAWVYQGKPLAPNAPFLLTRRDIEMQKDSTRAISLTPFFLEGMKDIQRFSASAIPVEKIQCPLLLISGEEDQMWPATLFASQIQQRLKAHHSPISCCHYSYAGAGHSIAPSGDRANVRQVHSLDKLWFNFGGNFEEDTKASLDAWEKTLQFFSLHLMN